MPAISITIPEKQSEKLQSLDISDLITQFLSEYFEFEEDRELKKRLADNPRIQQLTTALADAV